MITGSRACAASLDFQGPWRTIRHQGEFPPARQNRQATLTARTTPPCLPGRPRDGAVETWRRGDGDQEELRPDPPFGPRQSVGVDPLHRAAGGRRRLGVGRLGRGLVRQRHGRGAERHLQSRIDRHSGPPDALRPGRACHLPVGHVVQRRAPPLDHVPPAEYERDYWRSQEATPVRLNTQGRTPLKSGQLTHIAPQSPVLDELAQLALVRLDCRQSTLLMRYIGKVNSHCEQPHAFDEHRDRPAPRRPQLAPATRRSP